MLIRHKNPGYAGDVVIATRLLSFKAGVAEADLSLAQAAAVKAKGHTVEPNPADSNAVDAANAMIELAKGGYGGTGETPAPRGDNTPPRPTELTDDVEMDAKPTELYDYTTGDATA